MFLYVIGWVCYFNWGDIICIFVGSFYDSDYFSSDGDGIFIGLWYRFFCYFVCVIICVSLLFFGFYMVGIMEIICFMLR